MRLIKKEGQPISPSATAGSAMGNQAAILNEDGDRYLSLRALAAYSGLSVRTLRGYLTTPSHPLPHFRIVGKILVKRSEFDAWAAQFRMTAADRVDAMVAETLRGL